MGGFAVRQSTFDMINIKMIARLQNIGVILLKLAKIQ